MNDFAKFKWSCRRGMLELDLLLNQFLEHYFDQLTEQEKKSFGTLLGYPDPQIYQWLLGTQAPADETLIALVSLIRTHADISFKPL